MLRFAIEWSFVMGALLLFGAMGAWAIVPLRRATAFPVLAAPLAGMLIAAVTVPALYRAPGLPFRQAVLLSIVGNVGISTAVAVVQRPRPALLGWLALLAAVAGVVT